MPAKKRTPTRASATTTANVSNSIETLLLASQARGDGSMETGRFLVTYKEGAFEEGMKSLKAQSLRTADAREFKNQSVDPGDVGDSDALVFPEIGVALISGAAAHARGMNATSDIASDSPMQVIEPEYFVFASGASDYLRGFRSAADTIARDIGDMPSQEEDTEVDAESLGNTWGLIRCKVPPSTRSGFGIKVAVLDTGFSFGHPDFIGRLIFGATFAGQPVQDLHGHGTHCIGTSCGPLSPPGLINRYGIAHRAQIFVGKVLTNSGSGTSASVLAGMNWAIANRCAVISMSLGGQGPVQAAYTAAGNAALNNGCLIIAAAGNAASNTGSPANSPSIFSVASLDVNLAPSSFSNFGKIEIAAPGRDIFSAAPMPKRYQIMSGTSMATPHVAGCAALWAETSPALRGMNLWNRLRAAALPLPFPPARVGRGLVQAP